MRNPFKSKYTVTQTFANKLIIDGKDYYAQFGLKGHEGLDLVPTGTDLTIFCLADGVVVKDEDNAKSGAYGINVTVWHSQLQRATQYCHLSSNLVTNGEFVKAGQAIGYMGQTGNTMGAHLHLNLFAVDTNGMRLNRDNGYLGGIDPLSFLQEDISTTPDIQGQLNQCVLDRNSHWNFLIAIADVLQKPISRDVIVPEIERLVKLEDAIREKDKQIGEAQSKITELQNQITELTKNNEILQTNEAVLTEKVTKQQKMINDQGMKISSLQNELQALKMTLVQGLSGWKLIVQGLKKLLGWR